MKKNILFIADKPNWAYHFIIKTWAEKLQQFNCYIAFAQDFNIRPKQFSCLEKFKNNISCALNLKKTQFKIHPSKKYAYPIYKTPPVYEVLTHKKTDLVNFDAIIEMAYYFQYMSELPFSSKKRFVGLYTDSFPHEGPSFDSKNNIDLKKLDREEFYNLYLKHYDGLIVGNKNLYDDYHPFTEQIVFANGIYLQNEFIENKNVGKNTHLTIGWTGNPNREMKGFKEIIEPSVEIVRKTGRDIILKTKFSGEYRELLSFYKDVDLVVIASNADTGPSLFAEACLSGVPSISTNIGFPKMIIKQNENGIIINRDIQELANAIIELYDNRDKLITFSKRIKKDYLKIMDNEIFVINLKKLYHDKYK